MKARPHPVEEMDAKGPQGGPAWRYRGTVVCANVGQTVFTMVEPPPGFPGKWGGMGSLSHMLDLFDCWIDTGKLLPPYRIPSR